MLGQNTNDVAWILLRCLVVSAPCITGLEQRHFGYTLFQLHIGFIASGAGSTSRGLPIYLSPSHVKSGGDGRRVLLPLSGLCTSQSCSPTLTGHCSSVHFGCPLNSSSMGLALSPVLRTHIPLGIPKYTKVFQSLDGEIHGNFRFTLKLITNRYCWADECMKLGSLQLCVLLLDYPLSNALPLAVSPFRTAEGTDLQLRCSYTLFPSQHLANAVPELPRVWVCVFFSRACWHKGTDLRGRNVFENITFIKLVRKFGSHLEGANRVMV